MTTMTSTTIEGYRLSPQQARQWALRRDGGAPLGVACVVRLPGEPDPAALREALASVVRRHEVLRTAFHLFPGDELPVQVVLEEVPTGLLPGDAGDAPWRDLAAGDGDAPPLRAALVRPAGGGWALRLALPGLVADAATLDALVDEAAAAYEARLRGDDPFQYVDYSEWLHETLAEDDAAEGRAFWAARPRSAGPALPDPWPGAEDGAAEPERLLPFSALPRLEAAASAVGVGVEAWLLAAWRALLARHLEEDAELAVGVGVDGRTREELRGALGPYTRYVPLAGEPGEARSFAALAARTEGALREARAWQTFFTREGGEPGPRWGFDFAVVPDRAEWSVERRWHRTERFDARLSVTAEGEGGVRFRLYSDALSPEAAGRLLRRYLTLLDASVADPAAPLDALPLLDDAERAEAVGAPAPDASFPADEPLHRRFERQAARTPGAPAVTFLGESLTYAELDARADALAALLRARGVGPETRVALCLERGPALVVAILATLKAGGAYVPLDPAYPAERLAYVLEDAGAGVLVTEEGLVGRVPEFGGEVVLAGDASGSGAAVDASTVSPDSLAYVIYTSGSTGRPKGVQVTHRNAVRLFRATEEWFGFGEQDVWTLFHSYAFDFSVWEIWGALLYGGRLVVVPWETSRDPAAFRRLLAEERVTVLNQTPSAFRQLAAADAGAGDDLALRYVVFGGEALEPGTLRAWTEKHGFEAPRLVNMYGITETTVHVTYRPVEAEDVERGARSPVGVPIPDLRVHVLDGRGEPAPPGVAGEMYVGGAGVARGYLGRPELTAERFVPDPFGGEPGARLYRSGDRARRLPGGELEYLGRADQQVKVRGFRIEPGEIEAVLLEHPGVADAAVVAREGAGGEKRLVGYVVPRDGADPSAAELRAHLHARLPEHMVPAAFVVLERLPLTPNGKLDRRALPEPAHAAAEEAYAPPATVAEEVLAAVWAEVLGLERVGVDDNFFSVGGDSILSIRVVALARERGLELSIADVFGSPTVRELAGRASPGGGEPGELEAILRRERRPFDLLPEEDRARLPEDAEDAYPLSSLQGGMLYHQELTPEAPAYQNVDSYHFAGPWDEAAFRAAVRRATARQENLRTSIHLGGFSEPLQVVHREAEIPLRVVELRHLDDEAQLGVLAEHREGEFRDPLDLTRAPLMRLCVHLRADDRFQITATECHAINDGWSFTSLFADVFTDYAALVRGEPLPERPELPVRFRDFVELERTLAESGASRRFWAEKLAGFVPGRLPRPAAPRDPARGATEVARVPLTPELSAGVQRLARSLAVPLKSVLLAAHLKVLGLLTGETDVVTGLATNGRPEVAGGTEVRGLFLNTVPFRMELSAGASWRELVMRAFRGEAEILPHRRHPLATLQREHGPERLFEASFNLVRFHSFAEVVRTGVVRVLGNVDMGDTSHPLRVGARLHPVTSEIIGISAHCRTDVFTAAQVRGVEDRWRRVLESMVADPDLPHDALLPLTGEEREEVLERWNETARPFSDGACLHEVIEARARSAPDAPAVAFGGEALSYAELDRRANRVAHGLRRLGVGPETRVALFLEPGLETAVAVLATLKAGGAYVPLDPASPADRLAFLLEDSGARLVLAGADTAGALPDAGVPVVALSGDAFADEPDTRPESGVGARNLAYVIYTSGSTGRPKGVLVEHRGVVNSAEAYVRVYDVRPGSRVLLFAPLHFDASVLDVFTALFAGATLVVAPREAMIPGPGLVGLLRDEGITHLKITPSALASTPFAELPGLEAVMVGGESCTAELVARWAPGRRFFNGYGATEHSVRCTAVRCTGAAQPPPVGRPVANARLYVLDAHLQPLPVGVPGEVYMAGWA